MISKGGRPLYDVEKQHINEAWELANPNKKASIDAFELKIALKCLGFDVPKDVIRQMAIDSTTDPENPKLKVISKEFFTEIVTNMINERDVKSEITKAFSIFDEDHTGRISFKNLRLVTDNLGLQFSDNDLREMIEEADFDNDGEVDIDEFFQVMKKTTVF